MQRQRWAVMTAWAVGLLGGCGDVLGPQAHPGSGNVTVANAFLQGDVGYVQGINRPADDAVLLNYGGTDELDVMVDHQDGNAVMMLLQFSTGLADLANHPGTRSGDEAGVSATGCAGPVRGSWDYDEPADHTSVSVVGGSTPNVYRVDFTSSWLPDAWSGTPARSVQGHFNFSVDSGTPSAGETTSLAVTAGNVSGAFNGVEVHGLPQSIRASVGGGSRVVTASFPAANGHPAGQLVVTLPLGFAGVGSFTGPDAPVTVQGRTATMTSLAATVSVRTIPAGQQNWITFTASWANQDSVQGSFAVAR